MDSEGTLESPAIVPATDASPVATSAEPELAEAQPANEKPLLNGETSADDQITPALQPVDSISLGALFDLPLPLLRSSQPTADATRYRLSDASPSALVVESTIGEPASQDPAESLSAELNVDAILNEISSLKLDEIQTLESQVLARIEPLTDRPSLAESPAINSAMRTPLNLSDEYRDLRDHFLSRFYWERHATLLLMDAGRRVTESAWAIPFVSSLLEHVQTTRNDSGTMGRRLLRPNDSPPKALFVEAAGMECGVARAFGLNPRTGLANVLRGEISLEAAIQFTSDPQIQLLSGGHAPLFMNHGHELAALWSDLCEKFELIIILSGPVAVAVSKGEPSTLASLFFPLTTAAILTIELDGTPEGVAQLAKMKLAHSGVNLLGCVVRGDASAA